MEKSKFNRRFLDNTTLTMNGVVFKDYDAFEREGDEVCYISEYGLEELYEADHEMTDEEIINQGIGDSYNSIVKKCEENLDRYNEGLDEIDKIHSPITWARSIWEDADWAYISTYIEEDCY